MPLIDEQIIASFEEADAILRGHFILSSGLHSDTYLQCARVLMDSKRADYLCKALAEKVIAAFGESCADYIIAPAMGGVVVGYEMGRQLGISSMFCERVEGKFALRRGFDFPSGARILVVEDVVTTGLSSMEVIQYIESKGGVVIGEACLVNREQHADTFTPGYRNLSVPLVPLLTVQVRTFAADTIPPSMHEIPAVKPGSRNLK